MKTLFASLFAALFALNTLAAQAAAQAKDGIVVAAEEKTDGDKAPTTDTEKNDATLQSDSSSAGANAAPAAERQIADEEKTDGDKAPTTDTEKQSEEDKDKDKDEKKSD